MSNTVHDMGGVHGYGPIPLEDNEPVFHEPWEGRVLGLMMTASAHLKGNIDNTRSESEMMPPEKYLSYAYYERWFVRMERACARKGLVTRDELANIWGLLEAGEQIGGDLEENKVAEPLSPEDVRRNFASGRNYIRQLDKPAVFAVGETVRAKNMHPKGHTRLPRYARGKLGVITAEHGGQIYPDTNATFSGEGPERLYTVRFTARELWGPDANPNDTVCLDLWEPYLEKADS
jgi:nitrile hydratase beta subunit